MNVAVSDDIGSSEVAALAALRRDGAWRLDAARFRYLESLATRLPAQPPAVRGVLQARLQAALADYAGRWAQARQAAADEAARLAARQPALGRQARALLAAGDVHGLRRLVQRAQPATACEPLARLNEELRTAAVARQREATPGEPSQPNELASVARMRLAWSSQRARQQLAQATARKPANAGPLNSHALVLRSLGLMQSLSPDYLRRFLQHVESLQWLDRASALAPAPAAAASKGRTGRTARRGRAGK